MNKNVTNISFLILVIAFLPIIIFAQGLVPCDGPDCDINSVFKLINGAIKYFLSIAISIAAITFAWAGAKILLAQGDPGKIKEAKNMIWNTVWGMVIVLCSWVAVYTVIKWLVPNASSALRFLGS